MKALSLFNILVIGFTYNCSNRTRDFYLLSGLIRAQVSIYQYVCSSTSMFVHQLIRLYIIYIYILFSFSLSRLFFHLSEYWYSLFEEELQQRCYLIHVISITNSHNCYNHFDVDSNFLGFTWIANSFNHCYITFLPCKGSMSDFFYYSIIFSLKFWSTVWVSSQTNSPFLSISSSPLYACTLCLPLSLSVHLSAFLPLSPPLLLFPSPSFSPGCARSSQNEEVFVRC